MPAFLLEPPPTPHSFLRGVGLLGITLILGFAVLAIALVVLSRQRRLLLGRSAPPKRRKPKSRPDPWAESARRLRVAPAEGADDDTVDIDPDDPPPPDLGPGDVNGPTTPR